MPASKKHGFRDELHAMRDDLIQLKDEVRLKIHLGEMDAEDAWKKLKPRIDAFEKKAEAVTEDVADELKTVGADLKTEVMHLRDRLRKAASS